MKEAPGQEPGREVSLTFRVRYAETDAMGVVHHSSYIIWFEMGRTEFMRAHGFTYRQLEESGVLLPVLEVTARYRQPAYYDDELRISTTVDELTRTRIKMAYRIERVDDRRLLAEGSTLHAFTGPNGRPILITHHPEAWARLQSMAPHLAGG